MRVGKRKSRNKVLFLVRFFEIWCGEKELIERAQRHIKALHEERLYDKHAFYLTQALSRTGIPVELQHELVSATRDYLSAQKSEFVKELDKSHLEVLQGVVKDVTDKNYDSARKKLINDGANPQEINYTIGNILRIENKDFQSAVEFYPNAANKGHIGAMYNLAQLYQNEHKDIKSAERYYKMAVEKGNTDAMNNLAVLYQTEYKDIKSAERYYKMAIEKGDTDAMNNLAVLYRTERKDIKSAERYYKMAVEKGHTGAMYNLAVLYYKLKKNKTEALSLQKQAYISERNDNRALSYIAILLWNNEIEEAVAVYQKNFDNEEIQKAVNEYVPFILLMFIAKKQYHFVYNLFSENKFEIKDKYKPIYYALLFLMGEEYSDEFKKMGSELKETVDEIIETIKQMSIDYV